MTAPVPVTFFPSGATVLMPPGSTVAEAAQRAGVVLSQPCGTRGICGECGIRVLFGELAAADPTEAQTLRRAPAGVRLACRARVVAPVGVKPVIPERAEARMESVAPVGAEVVAGVDLGTTNVSAVLLDARTGVRLAASTTPNRQERFGADVLSRMAAALAGSAHEISQLAEASIVEAIELACEAAGATPDSIVRIAVAGNTTMASLLLGLDVARLATHPFEPPFAKPAALVPSAEHSSRIPALAGAVVLPPIASFVGGDALAAALATGLLSPSTDTRLLVDVGTNAEIVLRSGARLVVASAAAGPAFEGWGVSSGGRAGFGAVDGVVASGYATRLETSGGEAPDRFSGAGLVSALAALRALGWLGADGRIDATAVPATNQHTDETGVISVVLGSGERTLALSQLDIRALQLAKAAVRTGIERALRAAAVRPAEVRELLLAGAFGHALDANAAESIGLVPVGLGQKTRSVGNAALTGAAMVAASPDCLEPAVEAARFAEHLDLAADPSFQDDLLNALQLQP